MNDLYMKDLIPKKHKHLLYKDESPELCDFLLLNYAEVYRYSENTLRLLCWSPSKRLQVKNKMRVSNEWGTDDGLLLFDVNNSKLNDLIALGATKQRIHKRGKTLLRLEEKLGHKIYPFNPQLGVKI